MHFITDQQDDTTIFRLRESRLDSRNAGQLKAEFLILAQPDIQNLIVDLSEVGHIDSAGLSALLLAQRQMSIHDGELRVAGVTGEVRSLLEMTQLDRVFRIFDTTEEAVAAPPIFRNSIDRMAWEEERAALASERVLGPDAPSARDIRSGAIAAGGSLSAAALAEIMMNTTLHDEFEPLTLLALGDEEDDADDDLDEIEETFDDDDDDFDDDDDLDEEDDAEDPDKPEKEADAVEEPDDLDEDFEDDDWDDEELEDDDEEDY